MMDAEASHLQTMTQASIALAGFAGVIAAFSKFRIDAKVVVYRVRLMVVIGLVTAIFAQFPFVPIRFGLSEAESWRLSAALLALGMFPIGYWVWVQVRPLYKAALIHTQVLTAAQYVVTGILALALLVCAVGGFVSAIPAIYMATLFFCLVMCSYYFIMLINAVDIEKK